MPKFVSAAHRRNWIKSMRGMAARRRTRDALESGAVLGQKNPVDANTAQITLKALNGKLDEVLSALRVERARSETRTTDLDKAILSLEAVKPRHAQR